MSLVLGTIRNQHHSIRAVLHGMEYLLEEHDMSSGRLDLSVFRVMLYYLDTFSERVHHPNEEHYLFRALRGHDSDADKLIAELSHEHTSGRQQLNEFANYLLRYQEGGEEEYADFADAADRFVQGQWDHMRKEDEKLLPMAEQLLAPTDWKAIDHTFERNRDPIEEARDTGHFQKLFKHIVSLAPPPITTDPTKPN